MVSFLPVGSFPLQRFSTRDKEVLKSIELVLFFLAHKKVKIDYLGIAQSNQKMLTFFLEKFETVSK